MKEQILILSFYSESLEKRFVGFLFGIIIFRTTSRKSKTSEDEVSQPRLESGLAREQTKRNQGEEKVAAVNHITSPKRSRRPNSTPSFLAS